MVETDKDLDANNSKEIPQHTNNLPSEEKELFDVINPYPAGHSCFRLYEKTSEENKMKMRKNISINARGNVETMWREFIVLNAAPNGVDILQKDGVSYFLGDAAQREAEKQGYTLFDTPAQADTFIDQFVWGDNEKNKQIWNMLSILWLYWHKLQTWFYGRFRETDQDPETWDGVWQPNDEDPKEWRRSRDRYHGSYAVLTKTQENKKYWVMAGLKVTPDSVKSVVGLTELFTAEFGYPAIVSRPIQK